MAIPQGFRRTDLPSLGGVIHNDPINGIIERGEPYVPRVGDRVSLEGEVKTTGNGYFSVLFDGSLESCVFEDEEYEHAKLLSRKSPRKVTRAELEKLVGGEFELVEE